MQKTLYCLVCNTEFEVNGAERCPCCGAVGDDLIDLDELNKDETE